MKPNIQTLQERVETLERNQQRLADSITMTNKAIQHLIKYLANLKGLNHELDRDSKHPPIPHG